VPEPGKPRGIQPDRERVIVAAPAFHPRTPGQLIDALQARDPAARAFLWEQIRPSLERLIDRLVAQHQLTGQRDRLVVHSLHTSETWLRTRPVGEFDRIGWPAFQAAVLIQVAKLAAHPYGRQTRAGNQGARQAATSGPLPLPETPLYQSQTFFLPFDRFGNTWFGGDWFGGQQASDGSLWILLADITGHGFFAYLLASTMPSIWQKCWPVAANNHCEPADLLAAMHHLFEGCLPEGIYVEGTLVRLDRDGTVTVAPAGGTRLLLRRKGANKADLIKLRGTWLGLAPPHSEDQQTWRLEQGDELLLGTDGMFDQLADTQGRDLDALLEAAGTGVFETVTRHLRESLRDQDQKDDITVVALRRLAPKADAEGVSAGGIALSDVKPGLEG
jgi:Stage II sporulation protein E (SpoIIE)